MKQMCSARATHLVAEHCLFLGKLCSWVEVSGKLAHGEGFSSLGVFGLRGLWAGAEETESSVGSPSSSGRT